MGTKACTNERREEIEMISAKPSPPFRMESLHDMFWISWGAHHIESEFQGWSQFGFTGQFSGPLLRGARRAACHCAVGISWLSSWTMRC